MAIYFKIKKGLSSALPSTKSEGTVYFVTDNGKMYIDTSASARILVNAGHADTAATLNTLRPTLSIGNESNAITIQTMGNGDLKDFAGTLGSIRTGIDFPWYQTHWRIGNIRGGATDSTGFGFAYSADGTTWTSCSYINPDGTYMGLANQASCIKDSGDGRALYFNYSANAMTSCSWLAAWNGNTLQSIAPSSLSVNYASTAGSFNSSRTIALTGAVTGSISSNGASGWSIDTAIKNHGISPTNFTSTFRTQTKGDSNSGSYFSVIRNDNTDSWGYMPIYGSGIAFGRYDTHTYLYTAYNDVIAYIGGGSGNNLNWVRRICFTGGEGASGTWNINVTGSAGSVTWDNVTGKPSTYTPSSHTHSYLPLSGGALSGRLTINTSLQDHSTPTAQCLVINSSGLTDTITAVTDANSPGIGIHIGNVTWGSLILNNAGWKFCNSGFTGYMPVYASTFYGDLSGNATTATSATKATQDGNGATISSTYLKLSGGTMTGALNFANGAWNKAGDDAQFGDNNTAGSFAIQGLNGNTNLKMVTYGGTTYGTITWNGSQFVFSNTISGTCSNADTVDGYHASSFGINYSLGSSTDLNTATHSGFYRLSSSMVNGFTGADWGQMLVIHGGSDTIGQLGMPYSESALYIRSGNPSDVGGSGSWKGWVRCWRQGDSVTGAVWNDYAEYRESNCVEFGRVLYENGDDTLSVTTKRLQAFAGVSSDTWGFCQGETKKAKTPVAVAGRVLVYPYRDRNEYKPGDCVCAAPNGTVDIMTRAEIINYPDRIVGTVSCIPEYELWGEGDREPAKVNGRIWIKIY